MVFLVSNSPSFTGNTEEDSPEASASKSPLEQISLCGRTDHSFNRRDYMTFNASPRLQISVDDLQFSTPLCSPRPQATHNRGAVCLTLKQWLIPASEQGRFFPVQVGQVRVHTTTGLNSSTPKASPSPIHSTLCTTVAIPAVCLGH